MPLTATTAALAEQPARLGEGVLAVRRRAGPGRPGDSRGPQSGQQTVCAWKRRSAGSAYSAAQSAHIAKPAIVVAGRS